MPVETATGVGQVITAAGELVRHCFYYVRGTSGDYDMYLTDGQDAPIAVPPDTDLILVLHDDRRLPFKYDGASGRVQCGVLPEKFTVHVTKDWNQLVDLLAYGEFGGSFWLFRGERESRWTLQTTLERAVPEAGQRMLIEIDIYNRFKAQARTFLRPQLVPKNKSHMEWLALLQHHGGATRLLDWTASKWVALFFAVEHPPEQSDYCALWAINSAWLVEAGAASLQMADPTLSYVDAFERAQLVGRRERDFAAVIRTKGKAVRGLFQVSPQRLSERMSIQQGQFICPGDISISFVDNLPFAEDAARDSYSRDALRKILIPKHLRARAISHLREHNISRATLFPGLDGFTQSLAHFFVNPRSDEEFLDDSTQRMMRQDSWTESVELGKQFTAAEAAAWAGRKRDK